MITNSNLLYHFVGRTPDQDVFKTQISSLWLKSIYSFSENLKVHAYVLMPNHFHLLTEATGPDLDLKCFSGLEMVYERIINFTVYSETYRYIALNPVRGGLCKFPHHYPYSTFSYHYNNCYKNKPPLPFLLHSRISLGFGGVEGELRWILSQVS